MPRGLVLRKPETRSAEDQQLLLLLQQAHPQVGTACANAQAFVLMIRERNASVLEPWLKEATESRVPELRTFANGIKRDQDAIQAALMYEWREATSRRTGPSSQAAQTAILWTGWI